MINITYSPEAEEDIDTIKDYLISRDGIQRARDIISSIVEQTERLTYNPERFRIRPELGENIHLVTAKNFNIYYRIKSDGVEILRIIYGNRLITKDTFHH